MRAGCLPHLNFLRRCCSLSFSIRRLTDSKAALQFRLVVVSIFF